MTKLSEAIRLASETGSFVLDEYPLKELPSDLAKIRGLREIYVRECKITTLPAWLAELDVVSLDLADNPLKSFPRVILGLANLRMLGMSSVDIGKLPDDIGTLTRLETLVLPNCRLDSVPDSLADLTNLKGLDLGFNRISNASRLVFPSNLVHLILSGNPLAKVPESVRGLVRLQVLELSNGGANSVGNNPDLREMQPHLEGYHSRLTGIGRHRSGRIDNLPGWLFEIPGLEWLDFAGNQITHIPHTISNLTKLRGLILSGNRLSNVPSAVFALDSVQVLALDHNSLVTLPEVLPNVIRLRYLSLNDNPLPIPPEILSRRTDPEAIWDYIVRTREDRRPLDEAKLLVVGEGAVGKSSIIRRLTRGDYNPDERKTEGIDVTQWSLPVDGTDIAVNVWDFGGQEIMHATHQFFLTRRSVYLLVIDARQGEEQNRIEYWLKLIQGFSGGSPVILVGNKCENFGLDIDQRGLRGKYPDIVDIIETSCVNNVGVDAVRRSLGRTIGGLAHVRDLLPDSFFAVKEYLEKLDANYLPFADYERLCRERGINSPGAQELLVGFLHDLGTVLCFRNDPRLRDTNILNPSWVTGGVYRLLNSNLAAQVKGLLTWREIDVILGSGDDYPPDKRQFIIEMMKKFELCYESDQVSLVPDLLTKEEPDTGSWEESLRFAVQYDVLPSSIIGRLVVRMHRLISRGTVWRTGVVLTMDNNRALVKADREEALLTIRVSGPARSRRGLLTAIRAELRAIELTIPGLTGEEQVSVPGNPNVWVPYSHLLNLESAGKETVIPHGLVDEFRISELLDGIEARTDRARISPAPEVERSTRQEPGPVGGADGVAWTPRNSLLLGSFLLGAIVVVTAAYIVANKIIGQVAGAAAAAMALLVVVVIAFVVLRTAGRVDEQTMLEVIKEATSRVGNSQVGGDAGK